MLGPLPKVHQVIVSVVAIAVFVAFGAWAAFTLPIPLLALGGASIGAGLGVVAVLLLLHDPGPHRVPARPRRPHRGI